MPEFTLATRNLQTGRGSSKLSATAVGLSSGTIDSRGAQINPRATQIDFVPANIPNEVKDVTLDASLNFMETVGKAAFNFADRESTYFANVEISSYQREASKIYNGYLNEDGSYVQGYKDLQLNDARNTHSQYEEKLREAFNSGMGRLDEAGRVKALARMATLKNDYQTKGATHRGAETVKADNIETFKMLDGIKIDMADNPANMWKPDANGNTQKDKVLALHNGDTEAAQEWWSNALVDVTKGVYWNIHGKVLNEDSLQPGDVNQAAITAYDTAKYYYRHITKPQLKGSDIDKDNKLQEKFDQWRRDAISARADMLAIEVDERDLFLDRADENTEKQLWEIYGGIITGEKRSPTMDEFLIASAYSYDKDGWFKKFFTPSDLKSDPGVYLPLFEKAERGELTPNEYVQMFNHPSVNKSQAGLIKTIDQEFKKTENKAMLSDGTKYINDILFEKNFNERLGALFVDPLEKDRKSNLKSEAITSMGSCINTRGDLPYCRLETKLGYDTVRPSAINRPAITLPDGRSAVLSSDPALITEQFNSVNALHTEEARYLKTASPKEKKNKEYLNRNKAHKQREQLLNQWHKHIEDLIEFQNMNKTGGDTNGG